MGDYGAEIEYSPYYYDGEWEYRHVLLPKHLVKHLPKGRVLTEDEWRNKIGVQMGRGWVHYANHKPEPHILLYRRPMGTSGSTGEVDPVKRKADKENYFRSIKLKE